jgi:iron complex transport system ATP-binding protein
MALDAGDCCALLGRNGSGKSSLLGALAGLRTPAAGDILLDGRALASWPARERARRIAVLPQDEVGDFWGSTRDYVRLGRYPHGSTDAAPLVGSALDELDLAPQSEQPYRTLSGGERQRARIAQVLVQQAKVMLLDEPLQHLDLAHQAIVMQALAARAGAGCTLLMALHEPAVAARYCSSAVLLYDSERVAQGHAQRMLTQENLEALYQCRLETAGAASCPPVFFPAVR